jgi:hypothetical protein
MTRLLAVFVTFTAAAMTAVAAMSRGGNEIDKALLVAMSIAIVLSVHLLPALSRRPSTWLVWIGCLLCAIYGHFTFLTYASLRAGDVRAQQSMLSVGTERQIDAAREALAEIKARPVAIVAAELARSDNRRERAALRAEIAEGKRAEAIRDELFRLSGVATSAKVTGATDPVTDRLAAVTGMSENTVTVVIGMTFSILLELIGALLWYEALRQPKELVIVESEKDAKETGVDSVTESITDVTQPITDVVTVRAAINDGKCRKTVASIREFLGCSQARAMELRKVLVAAT